MNLKSILFIAICIHGFCTVVHGAIDPNTVKAFDLLCNHWLEPVVPIQVNPNSQRLVGPVRRYPDGSWFRVSSLPKPYRPLNYLDFADIARRWPGEPNKIDPNSKG